MTEREAEALIHQRAWTGQPPGLARIGRLLSRLGNPQKQLKFVHIAGSNGKGSTAAMLASVLSCAGRKAGLYTSPHLWRFQERFQVDGLPIPEPALSDLTALVLDAAEDETEFDLMTAIAMLHFQRSGCGIVVLETGLGGRLDATNVIPPPDAAVITNIGLEHTQLLGNTLEKIAAEKAGIIKSGSSVVLYRQSQAVMDVIAAACQAQGISNLRISCPEELEVISSSAEGQSFRYRKNGPFQIPLLGEYQRCNAAVVLETVDALRARGWGIPEKAALQGLAQARWPGRMELVRRSPDVLLDGGHNPQCMNALARALRDSFPRKKWVFLTGVLADKNAAQMLQELLPLAELFFTVTPDSPRAMPAGALAHCLERLNCRAVPCADLAQALDRALEAAGPDGGVCACGSLYMIGEARHLLGLC